MAIKPENDSTINESSASTDSNSSSIPVEPTSTLSTAITEVDDFVDNSENYDEFSILDPESIPHILDDDEEDKDQEEQVNSTTSNAEIISHTGEDELLSDSKQRNDPANNDTSPSPTEKLTSQDKESKDAINQEQPDQKPVQPPVPNNENSTNDVPQQPNLEYFTINGSFNNSPGDKTHAQEKFVSGDTFEPKDNSQSEPQQLQQVDTDKIEQVVDRGEQENSNQNNENLPQPQDKPEGVPSNKGKEQNQVVDTTPKIEVGQPPNEKPIEQVKVGEPEEVKPQANEGELSFEPAQPSPLVTNTNITHAPSPSLAGELHHTLDGGVYPEVKARTEEEPDNEFKTGPGGQQPTKNPAPSDNKLTIPEVPPNNPALTNTELVNMSDHQNKSQTNGPEKKPPVAPSTSRVAAPSSPSLDENQTVEGQQTPPKEEQPKNPDGQAQPGKAAPSDANHPTTPESTAAITGEEGPTRSAPTASNKDPVEMKDYGAKDQTAEPGEAPAYSDNETSTTDYNFQPEGQTAESKGAPAYSYGETSTTDYNSQPEGQTAESKGAPAYSYGETSTTDYNSQPEGQTTPTSGESTPAGDDPFATAEPEDRTPSAPPPFSPESDYGKAPVDNAPDETYTQDQQIEGTPGETLGTEGEKPEPTATSTSSLVYEGTSFNVADDKPESYDQAVKDCLSAIKKSGKSPLDEETTVTVNGDWMSNGKNAIKELIDSGANVEVPEGTPNFDEDIQEHQEAAEKLKARLRAEGETATDAEQFKKLLKEQLGQNKQTTADNTGATNPGQPEPTESDSLGIKSKDPQSNKPFESRTFIVENHTDGKLKGNPNYDKTVSDCLDHAAKFQTSPTELTATIQGSWEGKGAQEAVKKLVLAGVDVKFGPDFKPSKELMKLNEAAQKVRQDIEKRKLAGEAEPAQSFEELVKQKMAPPPQKPSWMAKRPTPTGPEAKSSSANPDDTKKTAPSSWTSKAFKAVEEKRADSHGNRTQKI